jgi:N-acetylneuraminic acid mutarotase
VESYDDVNDQWGAVASMSCQRNNMGVGVLDGHLYAVGGYGYQTGPLSSVERYDEGKNQWETVASMNIARGGLGVGSLGGCLYAVGGFSGTTQSQSSSVERYDKEKNQWEVVASMNIARYYMGVAASESSSFSSLSSVSLSPSSAPSLDFD